MPRFHDEPFTDVSNDADILVKNMRGHLLPVDRIQAELSLFYVIDKKCPTLRMQTIYDLLMSGV